jgi:hypothetical protein
MGARVLDWHERLCVFLCARDDDDGDGDDAVDACGKLVENSGNNRGRKNLLPNHKICANIESVGHPSKLAGRKYYGLPSGY